MTQFESPIKSIPHSSGVVFDFLSDFNSFKNLLPSDKISNWESTADACRFNVKGIGDVGLKIVEKEPSSTIKYTSDGKTPFNFFLWVQLKDIDKDDCRLKLTIRADLNPMLQMVVSDPVNKFLDVMANSIANYPYK